MIHNDKCINLDIKKMTKSDLLNVYLFDRNYGVFISEFLKSRV